MKKIIGILMAVVLTVSLSVPALAVDFVPSVEQKGAPTVQEVPDKQEELAAAIIHDEEKEEIISVPESHLIITPISEADEAPAEIRDPLKAAYVQITQVEALSELVPEIISALKEHHEEVTEEDVVVRDVFDVTVVGDYEEHLEVVGHLITVRFELGLAPDALLLVLHNHEGSEWEIISSDRVVINEDGSVDVTFEDLSPIVFVVDGAVVTPDPDGPQSPQTGVEGMNMAGICALVLGAVIVAAALMLERKKSVA